MSRIASIESHVAAAAAAAYGATWCARTFGENAAAALDLAHDDEMPDLVDHLGGIYFEILEALEDEVERAERNLDEAREFDGDVFIARRAVMRCEEELEDAEENLRMWEFYANVGF